MNCLRHELTHCVIVDEIKIKGAKIRSFFCFVFDIHANP